MEENNTWFDQFYNSVRSGKIDIDSTISSLGQIEQTSEASGIRNYFLKPFNDLFFRISISENTGTHQVTSIAFYSKDVLISHEYLKSISLNVKKQFIIYDEKVEYIFTPLNDQNDLLCVSCFAEEFSLNYTEEQDRSLKFDNVTFQFKR